MRRVLALVVAAAAIAVWAGLAVPSSALTVNQDTLSHSQLNQELQAIDASQLWLCFMQAQAFNDRLTIPSTVGGVPSESWSSVTTVEWTNRRATDLAIEQYVREHDPAALAPAALPAAKVSLERAIQREVQTAYTTAYQSGQQFSCSAHIRSGENVGRAALASMPAWFQQEQVEAQAAALALVGLLPAPLPESGPALEAWYAQHASEFDTLCVSVIVSTSASQSAAIASKIQAGLPFEEAAKRYSAVPSSAKRGGDLGCFTPASQAYPTVVQYVGSVPVHGLSPVTPLQTQTVEEYLLFTVTRRTSNPFASVEGAVERAVTSSNTAAASELATQIQRGADVSVSSTIGTWQPTLLGGTIVPPAAPPSGAVLNASANAPSS